MFDVIVSGAGPSGSKCAETIAKAGFKVALIERDVNWRKPCGGGCSVGLYKYYSKLRNLNLINKHTIRMYSADYSKFDYTYENASDYSFVIDRLEFDNIIRNVAVDSGAELFDKNISYEFIAKNQRKIGIKTKTASGKKEYLGKIIVIADGMSSKLALKSGVRSNWKTEDLGLAKCAIMEGQSNLDVNTVYFYFRPYMGYGWIFPIKQNLFNIGVITYYQDNFKYNVHELFEKFIKEQKSRNILDNRSYKILWSSAYSEPATGILEKSLYGENMLLIGDAAGFVAPITGEGIYASVISGKTAAETALMSLESRVEPLKVFKKYKSHYRIKKLIRNFKLMRTMGNFFYEQKGKYLNNTFKLAERKPEFKQTVADTFLFNKIPPKDFFKKIKNYPG